jgi:hypothetical protein
VQEFYLPSNNISPLQASHLSQARHISNQNTKPNIPFALFRHLFICLEKEDLPPMDRDNWLKIQTELNRLYELHESGVSDPGKCREFNSQASVFLQRLEDAEAFDIADRVMDLLAGCSPKDFSPCDNRQCTKGSLAAREN